VADGSGWFADPSGKINTFRWWDGQRWTRWLSADAAAPDPGPVPRRAAHRQTAVTAEPPPSAEARLAEPTDAQPPPQSFASPDPADRVVGLPAAAAIIVGGILLAIIAVGAIISLTADRRPPADRTGRRSAATRRRAAAADLRRDDAHRLGRGAESRPARRPVPL
jgi:Protein of unknown function (DUF2510)